MFKTIIATCLLTFSCSSGSLTTRKKENPNKATYIGSSLVVRGTYVFRDEYVDWEGIDYSVPIDITFSGSVEDKDIQIFCKPTSSNSFVTRSLDTFELLYTPRENSSLAGYDSFYFHGSYSTYEYSMSYNPTLFSATTIDQLSTLTTYTGLSSRLNNFVITFNKDYYLTGVQIDLFNKYFTPNGNKYCPYYYGYYHFNGSNWLDTDYSFNYDNFGLFVVKNTICNSYIHSSADNDSSFWLVGFGVRSSNSNSGFVLAYNGNEYQENPSNILVQSILPKYVYDCMTSEGVFMFIDDTPPTTWADMLFSTMDAPLYFLENLLSPTLFGINLFVAFAGLLTLVLIITVIKKVL